jgi:hypothetical protein
MAAVIEVLKTHGDSGSPTESVDTTFGLKSVDDHDTTPANAPVNIPDDGTSYSYETWLRFNCATAPSNMCNNFKVWGSGVAVATGVKITINTDAVDTYVTPVNTESAAGTRDDLVNHGSGDEVSVAGDLVDIDDKTDFIVAQLEVEDTAGPGNIPDQTLYYCYDET